MRQFVFFNKLQHFQAGHSRAVYPRNDPGIELRCLGRQFRRALVHRRAQFPRQVGGAGVRGQQREAGHLLAELRTSELLLAFQQQARKAMSGHQNMTRDLAEGHDIRGGLVAEIADRKLLDGRGRVGADCFPGIQNLFESHHYAYIVLTHRRACASARSVIIEAFTLRGIVSLRTFFRLFTHIQMMPVLESGEETLVGGQAVIEGVMMRAPHSYCVAVRKANGEIVTEEKPLARMSELHRIFKYPVVRGVGTLYQAMALGLRALKFSANAMLETESGQGEAKELPNWAISLNMLLSFAFFIFLYKFVPLYAVTALGKWYPMLKGRIAFNATDGLIRIAIFLAFLFLLSRMKDIYRVFEYHGAEHKVVFNFESGKPVNVENAQQFTTFHPRCGTSFLMVVMVVSMVVYTLIPFSGFGMKLLSRVILLPFIAGISYELIRFAAKRRGSFLATLTAPGLWLQRITTKPPSDEQAAVAIHALEGAMALEATQGGELVIA